MKKEDRLALLRRSYVENDVSLLTEPQVELRAQLEDAWKRLLMGNITQADVVKGLQEDYGISAITAHARIRDAKELFGDTVKANVTFERHLAYTRAEAIYQRALENNDLEVALKAVDTMAKVRGLDKDDPSLADAAKMEPHQYELQLDPRMERFVTLILNSGRINLTELLGDVPLADVFGEAPTPSPEAPAAPGPEALEGQPPAP